jgi:pimeloyl-ACP methyl ester carboxylesterase
MNDPFDLDKPEEIAPLPDESSVPDEPARPPEVVPDDPLLPNDKAKKQRVSIGKMLGSIRLTRVIRWGILLFVCGWVYLNWHPDLPLNTLVQQYTYPESTFLTVDGAEVHCRITGKGEPVVLLHDANSSMHTWQAWTSHVDLKKYQLISVDLPGFGLTGPHPRGSYSVFSYASFIDSLANVLKLKKFTLVGNGLGALVSWHYASEHADRINHLVLLSPPGFEEKSSDWVTILAKIPVLNRVLWSITPKPFVRIMLEDVYADNSLVTNELVKRHFDLVLRPGNRRAFTDRASVSDNRPPGDEVEKIKSPTLILWGAEDTRISPEYIYLFHKKIRKSEIRIYQNTGHWPQEENPARTAQDVQAFLEGKF